MALLRHVQRLGDQEPSPWRHPCRVFPPRINRLIEAPLNTTIILSAVFGRLLRQTNPPRGSQCLRIVASARCDPSTDTASVRRIKREQPSRDNP